MISRDKVREGGMSALRLTRRFYDATSRNALVTSSYLLYYMLIYICSGIYLVLNSITHNYTIYFVGALSRSDYFSSRSHYLVQTTLVSSVIKQKHLVYVGALSRSQANTDDRQEKK